MTVDTGALANNWRWLARMSGAASCGAALKANGYGTGALEAAHALGRAGCRDFFVATWAEAAALLPAVGDAQLSVLHGVAAEDMVFAAASPARPVLNTAAQAARWRGTGRPCDVMVDTGMNRLGLSAEEVRGGALDGLQVHTLMSHLACADEDGPVSAAQLAAFRDVSQQVRAQRYSLANSAGICLGPDYAFDLTRPGLALYGGIPRSEAVGHIAPVVRIEAQVIQRRRVETGEGVGYNHLFVADRPREVAILNIGYADGYFRGFSNSGAARLGDAVLPVIGRVSMDLTAIAVDEAPQVAEGDWVEIDFDLPTASAQSGMSQYELLTSLGDRFDRRYV
jgi:alanine racemase